MTLRLDPVTQDDAEPLIELGIAAARQRRFRAPGLSLAPIPDEPGATRFCIRHDGALVGFCELYDGTRLPLPLLGERQEAAFLSRLTIGAYYRRRGYGTGALALAADWGRVHGLPSLLTSAYAFNTQALAFFERRDFRRTGRVVEDEIELALTLQPPSRSARSAS